MRFVVVPNHSRIPREGRDVGFLWEDNWNDWFTYRTLYVLTYFDVGGGQHDLGGVKIGQFGMKEKQQRPELPVEFDVLDDRFFSLGQDESYYSTVAALPDGAGRRLLQALCDVVADPELFERSQSEDVTGVSLLRSVTLRSVTGQFRRVLDGGAILTQYSFRYIGLRWSDEVDPLNLDFRVVPESMPPTNIHVVVGRNGVGKTYLLNGMARALVYPAEDNAPNGKFLSFDRWGQEEDEGPFANVLSITFSAFDDFELLRESRNALKGIRYTNVGLRQRVKDKNDEWVIVTRDPGDLAEEFSQSAKICVQGERARRWREALATLEADPIFAEANVVQLANVEDRAFARDAKQLFGRLSSGHKIVLLTITKLVEKVEERTLVLMDEPEAHLHPPLLSAFIRALANLLINRNGVAIVATHSPVVLQEVPARCVWKIIRHGTASRAERPEIETFGETVGGLTHEVFGLEVTRSGFHRMLAEAIGEGDALGDVLAKFDNEVGSEGRAVISSLIARRDTGGGS